MSQAKEKISNALDSLMQRQPNWQDQYPGIPFVTSEKEFGITMGPRSGGLYAMHHLIDSLNLSDFFEGEREDRTDLDSMIYEFGIGEIKIYDGVIASRTENGMTLTINTNRPAEETLAAIAIGVQTARKTLDRRQQEKREYAENVRVEFAQEDVASLFGSNTTDIEFVKGYLKAKAASHFGSDPNAIVSNPLPAHDDLADIFGEYGITDKRPRFEITLTHTEQDYGRFNEFHNSALGAVFTAPLAVSVDQPQNMEDKLGLEVRGNPSRLARDIVRNDLNLARSVAKRMKLTITSA